MEDIGDFNYKNNEYFIVVEKKNKSKEKFKIKKYYSHFKTITKHKWYVMMACFRCGLIKQGLLHDLSKYSFTEFKSSAKYFQGNSSPIKAEKIVNGYSLAWQNHKGRNKHHWNYWIDFEKGKLIALLIPPKYLSEMICDWIGAGKAYNKGKWSVDTFKSWYEANKNNMILHEETRKCIEELISNVNTEKELYILAKPKRFEWWYLEDQYYGLHDRKPTVYRITLQDK